jgi:hypothetical protein
VLLLVPAAVAVLFALAAIAVDLSLVFLAERELAEATVAAANDAAAVVDEARFRAGGEVAVDCTAAPGVAAASFAARRPSWMAEAHLAVVSCEPDRVVVAATGRVAHVFGRALPGTPDTADVDATATAVPVVGGE